MGPDVLARGLAAPPRGLTLSDCRLCRATLQDEFVDLGMSPLANSFLELEQINAMEPFYPLRALVCGSCFLVQLESYESAEHIFTDYAYFSSYSSSWLDHARRYVDMAIARFGLGPQSKVVELASNDGYLLQYFRDRGVAVLGVEPAANVAEVAVARGVPTTVAFFGVQTATSLAGSGRADLLVGNNVLAHVPDLNDFVGGMPLLLDDEGVITLEFPHLMRLVDDNQFDTIYHEHFSYFSFLTAGRVLAAHGLRLFDVEELPTHGGSLRIFGCHEAASHKQTERARELAARERAAGYESLELYRSYAERVRASKREILEFVIDLKRQGLRIAGYGAPAKGNTLLNYCAIGRDFIDFTVDRSPHKQGRYLPGTHIPIHPPEAIDEERPDIVFILPWNLRDEIMGELERIRAWGGRFLVRAPKIGLH